MKLTNPDQLTRALNALALTDDERFDLNRKLANRTRQYFREQIRKQRDVDDKPYQSRKKRKITLDSKTKRAKDNKNMLTGFSRALTTRVDKQSFEVGISGVAGNMAREHNEGLGISFTTRVNGFYNSKTHRWEGGTGVKGNYKMTKRTFIGWTPKIERELLAMIAENFVNGAKK
ncbi:phage virion morphogenesis protein [Vibrio litoralis]|uniref:phage virion morphogenesis protein n=1 Tax=Vibrio litoralis TaxID=335972 RepID=UPI00040CFABC|nr:phage virion morphogenesis protein [Vibrio litoralis]